MPSPPSIRHTPIWVNRLRMYVMAIGNYGTVRRTSLLSSNLRGSRSPRSLRCHRLRLPSTRSLWILSPSGLPVTSGEFAPLVRDYLLISSGPRKFFFWDYIPKLMGSLRSFPPRFPRAPPAYLATSIRSLLLSTLPQPSAIFLSLWYIVRLPVYIGSVSFGPELIKEYQFRLELFGEDEHPVESHAPFRVFLLGHMLTNKWLDDHILSNKNW